MEFDLSKRHCFYFHETTKIPHGSYNEKALSDYIVEFAKAHNLKYMQDDMWNVIVYKPASVGYESAEPLIIQAHIDMVCEKNKDSNHNFETDPLQLYVEDGWLKAKGTTLGADDCAGAAYILAILEDDTLAHPALECIFTVQEEVGLFGAMNLKAEDISAHRMISLDGGGEVSTLLSSAGGCRADISKKLEWEDNTDACYRVAVRGLFGGHSGGEIHKEKGNANVLVARILKEAQVNGCDIQLINFNGGLKDNAIPREADMVFASNTNVEELKKSLFNTENDIKIELEFSDAGFHMEFEPVETESKKLTQAVSDAILDYAMLMPNGFMHRSMAIEGLTLTSLNLGVVEMDEERISFHVSIRSAIESGIDHLVRQLELLAKHLGFAIETGARYPGWNYSEVSGMRDIYDEVVQELYGKPLVKLAAHGGCECGVFKALVNDMDIISVGPVSKDIHTPDESLDLASFDRTYTILRNIVSRCK
ncbi:MAG: beta-Ala-His dipeptidase [Erysipelotrichaceae bacterium]|nr:beta-Ala-His dipeptidase [Erysipelotrichaceae bacterium]